MKQTILTLAFLSYSLASFSQALSNDTLHWTDYRTLSWSDFKGDTIDLPGLSGQTMMVMLANFQKAHLFLPTVTRVVTVFDRKNSWAINSGKTNQALKYNQISFDIYEVYTRRLRQEFKQTKFGLEPNKVFQEKYNATLTELSDRNKLFLKETKMGQDNKALDRWAEMIKVELKDLDLYRQIK